MPAIFFKTPEDHAEGLLEGLPEGFWMHSHGLIVAPNRSARPYETIGKDSKGLGKGFHDLREGSLDIMNGLQAASPCRSPCRRALKGIWKEYAWIIMGFDAHGKGLLEGLR